jgi:hypothetical protein
MAEAEVTSNVIRIITVLLAVAVLGAQEMDRRYALLPVVHHWLWFGTGAVIVITALLELRNGTAIFFGVSVDRATDRARFWSAIALVGLLGAGIMLVASGSMLGYWAF